MPYAVSKRHNIKQLVLAAVLVLCFGCSTLTTVSPQAPKVDLPVSAVPEPDPIPVNEPAEEVVKAEPRIPLRDLLKERAKIKTGQQGQKHTVQRGDTLGSIAIKYRVALSALKESNQLESDRILAGQKLIIPENALRIQIDKSENQLTVFNGEESLRTYPVATGDQGITPTGSYTIANRLIRPNWYWQGYTVTPDDPDYPLGSRWLGLSKRGYGIHGTNEPDSIGKQVSHGCIRMHNEDVEDLFEVVSVGTAVAIVE